MQRNCNLSPQALVFSRLTYAPMIQVPPTCMLPVLPVQCCSVCRCPDAVCFPFSRRCMCSQLPFQSFSLTHSSPPWTEVGWAPHSLPSHPPLPALCCLHEMGTACCHPADQGGRCGVKNCARFSFLERLPRTIFYDVAGPTLALCQSISPCCCRIIRGAL